MSTLSPEAVLTEAVQERTTGMLLDMRVALAIPVKLHAVQPDTLTLLGLTGRGPAGLPEVGAFVRMEFHLGRWLYRLSARVASREPLTLRLPGTLSQLDRRNFERQSVTGLDAWVDVGAGAQAVTVKNLSLGGLAIASPALRVTLGATASVRLVAASGELMALAKVRHVSHELAETMAGLAFGQLSPDACALLARWLRDGP